ncbi:hypothetical protein QOT17_021024 [Balamuthia mandrillaris]
MEEESQPADGVLKAIQDSSRNILRTALQCKVGAIDATSFHKCTKGRGLDTEEQTRARQALLWWSRYEQWLQRQILEYEATIERKKLMLHQGIKLHGATKQAGSAAALETRLEALDQEIRHLQEELYTHSEKAARDKRLVSAVQMTPIAGGCVFLQSKPSPEEEQLKLMALQRDRRASEVMAHHSILRKLREENKELRIANQRSTEQNQQLWRHLQALLSVTSPSSLPEGGKNVERRGKRAVRKTRASEEEEEEEEEELTAAEQVELQRVRNVLMKRVFQGLVLESGINWAKDPRLLQLMLAVEQSEG